MTIIIKDLTKKYGNNIVVNGINLEIKDGELFSLLGVNGAGKTTTIRMLMGLTKQTSGEATLNNHSISKEMHKIKSIVNISPQETAIAQNLTVKENLDFIAGIYGIKNKTKKINELIEKFELSKVLNQRTKTLSGGWQRKLSIAMSLINDPEILFLDEPTLGLDVIARRELWEIIEKYKGEKTIILTTHYMEESEHLSDRVAVMKDGNILDVASVKDLIKKYKVKTFEDAFIASTRGGVK